MTPSIQPRADWWVVHTQVRPGFARSPAGPVAIIALAILLTLVVHAVAAVSPYDDAFITFRYVRNVIEGRGPVYNDGERVFGISTPLYAAWLTLLQSVLPGLDLPVLAVRGNGILLAAAGILAYLLLVRLGISRWMAALAGASVMLSDGILRASIGGMESSMFLALVIGAALACLSGHDTTALLLACLSALARPEGVLLVGLVILARLVDPTTRSLPPRLWLALSPLFIWVVAATIYYGTPIPHSIIAKSRPLYLLPPGAALRNLFRHAGDWTLGGVQLVARAATDLAAVTVPWDRILPVGVLVAVGGGVTAWGIVRLWRGTDSGSMRMLLLPSFLLCLLILYAFTNPYLLPWYFPLVHAPWLLLILSAAAPRLSRQVGPAARARPVMPYVVTPLVCFAAFGPTIAHLGPSDWSLMTRGASSAKQAEILEAYRRTARWVESHSDSDETVAAPEIGILGYHMDRKILDACGLVSEEAIPFLPVPPEQHGLQQGIISTSFVRATSPDLVVTLPTFARPSLARSDWFHAAYELVHMERILHGKAVDEGVMVFRRRNEANDTPLTGVSAIVIR